MIEHQQVNEGAYWLIDDDESGDNPNINGLVTLGLAFLVISSQTVG